MSAWTPYIAPVLATLIVDVRSAEQAEGHFDAVLAVSGLAKFDEDDNSPLTVNLGEKLDTNSIRLVTPGTKDDKPQAQTTRSNPRTKKES